MRRFHIVGAVVLAAVVGATIGAGAQQAFDGPREGKGLFNEVVGEIPLQGEIASVENRHLRMRYWEIQPGGIVPVHSHANRPGIIWIEEGTIVEHRSDQDEPKVHGPGTVSIEADGVSHWWENTGDEVVILVAVDVYEAAN